MRLSSALGLKAPQPAVSRVSMDGQLAHATLARGRKGRALLRRFEEAGNETASMDVPISDIVAIEHDRRRVTLDLGQGSWFS